MRWVMPCFFCGPCRSLFHGQTIGTTPDGADIQIVVCDSCYNGVRSSAEYEQLDRYLVEARGK